MDLAAKIARRAIGWVLIALFGPAPFSALLAVSGDVECHMSCCKRSRGQHSCGRHGDSADSASVSGSEECRPDCSRAAAAFGSNAPVLLPPAYSGEVRDPELPLPFAPAQPATSDFTDPFLYQRPPPFLSR